MAKKYRFGVVGCGVIFSTHARVIQSLDNAELVAICDVDLEKAKKAAAEKCAESNPQVYQDYHEMLKRDDLDVISVCTPSGMHAEMAVEAMEAGKHVIVEKPMDVTLAACDRMIEAQERTGKTATVISQHRYAKAVQALKRAVDEGRFGRIALADSYTKWFRSHEYYASAGWRATWKWDGGGALMNQSVHYVDLLQWMLGDVDSLYANCATRWHDIVVEDVASATIRFKNGAIGTLEGTTAAFPGAAQRLEVMGEFGTVFIRNSKVEEWKFAEERPEDEVIRSGGAPSSGHAGAADPSAIGAEGHKGEYQDFLHALDNGTSPLITPREARKPVEIILAVYESARTGKPVKLPLDPNITFEGTRFPR